MTNQLFYGDNLQVLREHIGDESVDLIYLDPPFDTNASSKILLKSVRKHDRPLPAQTRSRNQSPRT